MEQTIGNYVTNSNKCNQCDFAFFQAGHLRRHMKMHNGKKSNKCNQCDFASSRAGNLRTHMLHQNPEKYRYFIFKNTGIGISVQSRYTGICRYTAGACWSVSNCHGTNVQGQCPLSTPAYSPKVAHQKFILYLILI